MALPSCPGLQPNRRVKERETLQLAHCENVRTRSRYDLLGGPGGHRSGRQRMRHPLRHFTGFCLQAEKIGWRRKTKSHQKGLVAWSGMNIEAWCAYGGTNYGIARAAQALVPRVAFSFLLNKMIRTLSPIFIISSSLFIFGLPQYTK